MVFGAVFNSVILLLRLTNMEDSDLSFTARHVPFVQNGEDLENVNTLIAKNKNQLGEPTSTSRAKRFSDEELETLIEEVSKHKDCINSKFNDTVTNKKKKAIWESKWGIIYVHRDAGEEKVGNME